MKIVPEMYCLSFNLGGFNEAIRRADFKFDLCQ